MICLSFEADTWLYASSMSGYLPGPSWKEDLTRERAILKVVGAWEPWRLVAAFAAVSAASFPGMFEWPGSHWMWMVASDFARFARMLSDSGLQLTSDEQSDWLSVAITTLRVW